MCFVPQFYRNILLYRRLRITFLQTLEHYSIFSFTFYQMKLFFLCKHKRNSNVLSNFTCFVSVVWHAVWHSHKQCMPTRWPRNAAYRFLNQVINIIATFFSIPSVSISIMSLMKKFGFVQWHQRELTLPS